MLFQPLGAAPHWRDIDIAALGAGARHAFGKAAVVAAQGAVNFVEDAVSAAMRAFALPVAGAARQHGRIAAPIQKNHALLTPCHPLRDGVKQGRGEHGFGRLVVHVHAPNQGQGAFSHAARHLQPHIAPAFGCRAAVVPALKRWRGRSQHHLGPLQPPPVDGQVTGRVACAFLLLVAGVVLFIDHDQLQVGQRRKHRHAGAQHNPRGAAVGGQPACQALRRGHAAVH